ncbi:MAG: hypothetical protein IKE75_00870 [Bacilli bacterium]|nr:hypothetical protein [Bacilli bacterium]
MTGELLNNGIDALKDINNIIMKFSERDENNNHDVVQIQEDLKILTDVIHQVFIDMVSVDDMREKIRIINETLEEHLSKFQ